MSDLHAAREAVLVKPMPLIEETLYILLIEDNRGDARLIREMMISHSESQIELTHAVTLREGLDALEQELFDAILLDLSLPDSSGIETIRRVHAEAPDQAILVLTGFSDQTLGVQAMQEGAQDYLVKGEIDGKLLTRAIRYAIERTRVDYAMRQQTQELAAIEERHRLARELHDSVSQTLFTCRSIGEAALMQWDQNPDKARALMEEANRLTAAALSEMRVLLLELRPASLTKVTMRELFNQYAQIFQTRRDLKIELEIVDMAPLPPDVQIALYRIMQEAINNTIKHASASHITITVQDGGGFIVMRIRDDGTGFAQDQVQPMSLGLGIMRERADAIGAELEIESESGQGTCVTVRWMQPEEV
ncbi:MAG: response regulator [bacterium]|nr:response regulator [bacterium]